MTEARKLAAILAADVVGFSRLASDDEDRTLARLRALRSDLIDPTMAVHHGRVVKRTGDGILAEFRSVVDGVRCAIELALMTEVLKQCGDDLSRANILRQATNIRDFELPMGLPGSRINTSPNNYFPIRQMQPSRFNGEYWESIGDIMTD